jgi:MoaA/NifB/PqqE/SkfB family radical SAM enzyme
VSTFASKTWDMLRLVRHGGPAICNIAITNSCNASCDFCNFARGKVRDLRWIDVDCFGDALDILRERGIRYLNIFGGEPLLHPRITDMVEMAVARDMGPAVITNGWLLPARVDDLAKAGLRNIYVSIDAANITDHESNRGLTGVCERIRRATARMPELGMTPIAQVAMSKLISNYSALAPLLRDLGFQAVTFSYPQRARLGSSSLAWSDSSQLMRLTDSEVVGAFDSVNELRETFPVNNPRASIEDMKHFLRREHQEFACYGGYKSFYMDWNYDMWRCDAWDKKLCSVWEFPTTPLVRDGCTACMADCYRDSSVMLHFSVSLGDAMDDISNGRILRGLKRLANRRNLTSIRAIGENAKVLSHLAELG